VSSIRCVAAGALAVAALACDAAPDGVREQAVAARVERPIVIAHRGAARIGLYAETKDVVAGVRDRLRAGGS
jgi:hypothetical protein